MTIILPCCGNCKHFREWHPSSPDAYFDTYGYCQAKQTKPPRLPLMRACKRYEPMTVRDLKVRIVSADDINARLAEIEEIERSRTTQPAGEA